ncbi:16S rRNA (adenine(1518)-N(6)/adenine(1519)-N(6))-dimethyltransferase RsmA [Treponema brennaborense]|uniref:Ribosomal RNA small subunit methyltransferase A n=1 Tax=Treponema brennaborense (strain DSM 12168 / CIP 105900 / DD5/3) TaxID=906968 RepID=F4LM47_TREBD|nr:16S rRNA (adenine(1518)-N(6)/adenine(1519)-N(6))-dimethyltransferase RsmA [Treponema brennaborense]AEE16726.1 Ribosomal RNA small subunit methyltransferase A [Treponema brennaborense DSM 12168]
MSDLSEFLPPPDYDSPAALKKFLDENGMAMQKKFGQNFLINGNARVRLIDTLDIGAGSTVWEVGPGLGAMTKEILSRGAKLTVFEIDRGFASFIGKFFEPYARSGAFILREGDVLKTWKQAAEQGIPDRFFGNLPYNIAAAIVGDLISAGIRFDKAVVTVQKEVAERMCAAAGDGNYSSFSVLCNWAYDVQPVMDLAGGNFWPRPNVDSRAVLMTKKAAFPCCENPGHFMQLQRSLFVSRRKTVKNNLTAFYRNAEKAADVLSAAGIDPQQRAERLTVEQLLQLSDISNQHITE